MALSILPQKQSIGELLGQGLGAGLGSGLQTLAQSKINGLLQQHQTKQDIGEKVRFHG